MGPKSSNTGFDSFRFEIPLIVVEEDNVMIYGTKQIAHCDVADLLPTFLGEGLRLQLEVIATKERLHNCRGRYEAVLTEYDTSQALNQLGLSPKPDPRKHLDLQEEVSTLLGQYLEVLERLRGVCDALIEIAHTRVDLERTKLELAHSRRELWHARLRADVATVLWSQMLQWFKAKARRSDSVRVRIGDMQSAYRRHLREHRDLIQHWIAEEAGAPDPVYWPHRSYRLFYERVSGNIVDGSYQLQQLVEDALRTHPDQPTHSRIRTDGRMAGYVDLITPGNPGESEWHFGHPSHDHVHFDPEADNDVIPQAGVTPDRPRGWELD